MKNIQENFIALFPNMAAVGHFFVGTIAFFYGYLFTLEFSGPIWLAVIIGSLLTLIVGVTKELFDKYVRKTRYSRADVRVTFLGAPVGWVMLASIHLIHALWVYLQTPIY